MNASARVYHVLESLMLNSENHLEYCKLHLDTVIINPFIVTTNNKDILIAYIQTVFDAYEN